MAIVSEFFDMRVPSAKPLRAKLLRWQLATAYAPVAQRLTARRGGS
jgi:hypothetical protein